MFVEVRLGARCETAVWSVAVPDPGVRLPSIEADLDLRLMGVHKGQLRQQVRLIPRDDYEAPLQRVALMGVCGTTVSRCQNKLSGEIPKRHKEP